MLITFHLLLVFLAAIMMHIFMKSLQNWALVVFCALKWDYPLHVYYPFVAK